MFVSTIHQMIFRCHVKLKFLVAVTSSKMPAHTAKINDNMLNPRIRSYEFSNLWTTTILDFNMQILANNHSIRELSKYFHNKVFSQAYRRLNHHIDCGRRMRPMRKRHWHLYQQWKICAKQHPYTQTFVRRQTGPNFLHRLSCLLHFVVIYCIVGNSA